MLDAIYHPNYVPDITWYKTQLLLWDNIFRIVPYSVIDSFGASKLAEIWDIPEKYFRSIDLTMPDKKYFNDRKFAIKNQLLKLSKKKLDNFCDEKHFYLNSAKIPEWVGNTLLEYHLRKEKILDRWGAKHYVVREDASNFLMSCVAHSIGQNRAMSPLTDITLSCFAIYGNQIGTYGNQKPSGENLKSLIAGVFNIMVPENIDTMNFKDILEIREEYSDLRKAVSKVITSLSNEFMLHVVAEEERANELLKYALNRFNTEVNKFKNRRWRRIFKDWKTSSVATVLGAGGAFLAGGPAVAVGCAVGGAGITLMNIIAGREDPSEIQKTVQYFNKIKEKIDYNEFIEGLINYKRIVTGEDI